MANAGADDAGIQALRNTPWADPVVRPPLIVDGQPVTFQSVDMPGVTDLQSYSLRNGDVEDVQPYLVSSSIPVAYHWVPINGITPNVALRCVDAMIRCHLYWMRANRPTNMDDKHIRTAAIALGAMRAVMIANYDLERGSIVATEMADPLLSVTVPQEGALTYNIIAPLDEAQRTALMAPLNLSDTEMSLVRLYLRCGQCVPPLQGLNLINDGHHYLSDKTKSSYKAFKAVELQLWLTPAMKELVAEDGDFIRDIMWHKSGHPISAHLKEELASSSTVRENLHAAKLGSAVARLPATETEIRCAETYIKVCNVVNAIWATLGGGINTDVLRLRYEAVRAIPRSMKQLVPPLDLGMGEVANTRTEALEIVKATAARNADYAAMAYGFYCGTIESNASETGEQPRDSLRGAHSLTKLKSNNVASYTQGIDLHRAYRAFQAKARSEGKIVIPKVVFES